jgi:tRNA threonylcarbamoyladenosine biosynthesis protein TsaE
MPIIAPNSLEIISRSPEQTKRLGMRIGALLQTGDIICLSGELGSGKTTLAQGMAAGWGSHDQVTSPTFVLVNVYRRADQRCLYHLDAYRLEDAAEAGDLDLETLYESGPLMVEWAERIEGALPGECLWVQLSYMDEKQRDLTITARGDHFQELISNLRKQVYGG